MRRTLTIETDGTVKGSRVLLNGEVLTDVKRIELVLDADSGLAGGEVCRVSNQLDSKGRMVAWS